MPLPLFLGIGAAIAATIGIGNSIHGGVKMHHAHKTLENEKLQYQIDVNRSKDINMRATKIMDRLGSTELEILNSFQKFSDIFERIQNRPEFKEYSRNDVQIPSYNPEEIKKVSVGAGVLLGGLSGAALGTAGGFAAAGATTAAVMALGTASTGTAIASLSGAAATNATLAALGGGSIAIGGGGIALGTTMLGFTTLGMGLLIGGIIFNLAGIHLSEQADKAINQIRQAKKSVNQISQYLVDLSDAASKFEKSLSAVNHVYQKHLEQLGILVILSGKSDWNQFSDTEKTLTENTVLLVSLLFQMCKVQLVLKGETNDELNKINHKDISLSIQNADNFIKDKGLSALT